MSRRVKSSTCPFSSHSLILHVRHLDLKNTSLVFVCKPLLWREAPLYLQCLGGRRTFHGRWGWTVGFGAGAGTSVKGEGGKKAVGTIMEEGGVP